MVGMLKSIRQFLKPVTRPVGRLVRRLEDDTVCRVTGMRRISELDPQDVFIVGYPKSGNTWFQHLTASIVYGSDPECLPWTLMAELEPDIHKTRVFRRYATPMFFKSHALPRPEYRRVVYLIRDGRDVMVSYYHYLSAFQGSPVDFARLVEDGKGLFQCKWHKHVEAWTANPHGAEMLVIRYEDLLHDGVEQLSRFCAFVGVERDRAFLEKVMRNTAFRKLSAREKAGNFDHQDPRWPRTATFFRRGEAGAYRDEMPEAILEAFMREAEPMLRQYQYL